MSLVTQYFPQKESERFNFRPTTLKSNAFTSTNKGILFSHNNDYLSFWEKNEAPDSSIAPCCLFKALHCAGQGYGTTSGLQ